MRVCEAPGCERKHFCRGFCAMHHARWKKHGDVSRVDAGGRPLQGATPSIHAIHKRLSRSKGPARRYSCSDCGKTAREWSYDHSDPNQLHGVSHGVTMAYSLQLNHYQPRCVRCHRAFDGNCFGASKDRSNDDAV